MPQIDSSSDDHVARVMTDWERERPDLDVSPQAVIARLHRLANRLTTELTTSYQEFGLSEGEFDVLATLRRSGTPFALTPSALAASTMVTSGAMTKRIDRLEARELVTRRGSESDGRGRVIALTRQGRELIDEAFTAHIANEHRLLAALTPDEATSAAHILTKWIAALD